MNPTTIQRRDFVRWFGATALLAATGGAAPLAQAQEKESGQKRKVYLTDYYRVFPAVLVRLPRVDRDALSDLLSVSWRLTSVKARNRGRCAVKTRSPR